MYSINFRYILEGRHEHDVPPPGANATGAGAHAAAAGELLATSCKAHGLADEFPAYVAYKLLDLLLEYLVPVALITALNAALVFAVRKTLARPLRRHSPALASERSLILMVLLSTLRIC